MLRQRNIEENIASDTKCNPEQTGNLNSKDIIAMCQYTRT